MGTDAEEPDEIEDLMARVMERPETEWVQALEEVAEARPALAGALRSRFSALFGAAPESATSRTLGDYVDLEELGRGGMGVVYRAWQRSLGRPVALKVVRPERLFFDGARQRFRSEVEAVAKLSHPGIVSIYAVAGEEPGAVPHFSMELLRGETLAEVLARLGNRAPESLRGRDLLPEAEEEARGLGRLDWPRAVARVGAEVARALQHAHERGVVHRDVKPSNVIIEPDGRVVVLDFGLTSGVDGSGTGMTASGQPVGTLAYMAPEQVDGNSPARPALDVYGLGATLYELLALQRPFAGASSLELRAQVLAGEVPSLRSRNRSVPRDLAVVVGRAMEPRAADRYGSAGDLAAELERVVRGEPVVAAPPSPAARLVRAARRRPARTTALALAMLVVLGGPALYGLLANRHARELGSALERERSARAAVQGVLDFTWEMFEGASPDENGGELPDAVEMLGRGRAIASEMEAPAGVRARVHLMLGRVYATLLEPAASLEELELAIQLERALPGAPSRELADALRHAAHARTFTGGLDVAAQEIEEAISILVSLDGPGAPTLLPYLATLADVAMARGDLAAAVEAREAAVLALAVDAEPWERASTRGALGAALAHAGDTQRARRLLEASLRLTVSGGGDHPTTFDGLHLALARLDLEEGHLDTALERARDTEERLVRRTGADGILTLQASLLVGKVLARQGHHGEALADFERAARGLVERLPGEHPLRLEAEQHVIAGLTALGRSEDVVALAVESRIVDRLRVAHGVASDAHRKALLAVGLANQARRRMEAAEDLLSRLEAAERAADPWSSRHGDAALLLCAHRIKAAGASIEGDGPEPLLREMITAIGERMLPVRSSTNGARYEGGAMARLFLAGILENRGRREEAADLRAEAEARRARFQD